MPIDRLQLVLADSLAELESQGRAKGAETVFTGVLPARGGLGPRFELEGGDGKPFLRMNSNSYLGMSLRPEVISAEEEATRAYGTGPGAVRFISGTYDIHLQLERRLAEFLNSHARLVVNVNGTLLYSIHETPPIPVDDGPRRGAPDAAEGL